MTHTTTPFGIISSGRAARLHTLQNSHGMQVALTDYGAAIVSIVAPDRNGALADVTLGYDRVEDYEADRGYLGIIAGRFANRIAHGRFPLDGREFQLALNTHPHHLHGGQDGFGKRVWTAQPHDDGLEFTLTSPDGDEGYPGKLDVSVKYSLTDADEIILHYRAESDAPTIVNLTNHAYFNLAGAGQGTILDHELQIHADRFVVTDENQIPTGDLPSLADTPMDFRESHRIGDRIDADFPALRPGGGYDHCYVIEGSGLRLAATAWDPDSGRVLEVLTDEPGLQFYSGNSLNGVIGKAGLAYLRRSGFCLEANHFPDSPNQPGFPSTVLRPGETYTQTTIYRFTTR